MRFRLHFIALPAVVVAAACGGGGDSPTTPKVSTPSGPTTPTQPSTPSAPVATSSVVVKDDFFDPANIQVAPGTTVTWSWGTPSVHNVTFGDGQNSGDKGGSGASYSRTFPTAGTFNYSCTLHGGMAGSVLVK